MGKYKNVSGMNDVYNTQYKIAKYIKDTIIEISETYNYKTIKLSSFEYTNLFTDYYGEDLKESLFHIDNKYSLSISLQYDLVLSMLRSIIENKLYVDKTLPIKLMCNDETYCFNKKNRKEKVNNEEFVLVNANYDNYYLDIESISLALDIFYALGMDEVKLVIYKNSLATKEFNFVKKNLTSSGIDYEVGEHLENEYYDNLEYKFYYGEALVASGGRHNNLASQLQAPSIPSASLKFDVDEIQNILEFSSLYPPMEEELDFLVVSIDGDYDNVLYVASRLRDLGVKVDISYNEYNSTRLRDFIDRMNIPYTILIDSKNIKKGIVTVRNSISKEEAEVLFENFINELIEHSKHHDE